MEFLDVNLSVIGDLKNIVGPVIFGVFELLNSKPEVDESCRVLDNLLAQNFELLQILWTHWGQIRYKQR